MATDFQREIYDPMRKNLSELDRINNQRASIVQKYGDPDAQAILQSRSAMNPYQQQIVNRNPNIQRDLSQLSSLDQMAMRMQNQKQMLENDYMQVYGNAMANANRPQGMIQRQTEDMMKGSALAQLRDQGFAMGQATKRGDSQAMKGKIQSDINRQGAEQRAQIQAQQMDRSIQAEGQRQQLMLNIAGQLQQQQQQDFQNKLTLQQMAQARSGGGGGGCEYGEITLPNGQKQIVHLPTYYKETAKSAGKGTGGGSALSTLLKMFGGKSGVEEETLKDADATIPTKITQS